MRRTLAPLVAGASADRILTLRVVDPAMGSGAFLVAACRYLARAYEQALVDEGRLAPGEVDEGARAEMRRLVAERCLAGVDANPVAVQLARLSMWLTTLAQGRPLTFLDHRLRTGNSLIGATPDDLVRLETRGRQRDRPLPLFEVDGLEQSMRQIVRPLADLGARPDATVADVRAKEAVWQRLTAASSPLAPWRLAADAWCARWFPADGTRPASPAELRAVIDAIVRHDRTLPAGHLARRLSEARSASQRHLFFHWWLEFSDVFYQDTGRPKEAPGFDAVLGNPPWEVIGRDRDELTRFVRDSGVYRTLRARSPQSVPALSRTGALDLPSWRARRPDRAVGTGGGRWRGRATQGTRQRRWSRNTRRARQRARPVSDSPRRPICRHRRRTPAERREKSAHGSAFARVQSSNRCQDGTTRANQPTRCDSPQANSGRLAVPRFACRTYAMPTISRYSTA